jgi:Uncharacterized protein conserved in bacteria
MSKNILISMRNTQIIDDEPQLIEVTARGQYFVKENKEYILFEERVEELGDVVLNRITIDEKNNTVKVKKEGSIAFELEFKNSLRHSSIYKTVLGELAIDITTKKLNVTRDSLKILIIVEYSLAMNFDEVAVCTMEIECSHLE